MSTELANKINDAILAAGWKIMDATESRYGVFPSEVNLSESIPVIAEATAGVAKERDDAVVQQKHAWDRHAEKDAAYGQMIANRDDLQAKLDTLEGMFKAQGRSLFEAKELIEKLKRTNQSLFDSLTHAGAENRELQRKLAEVKATEAAIFEHVQKFYPHVSNDAPTDFEVECAFKWFTDKLDEAKADTARLDKLDRITSNTNQRNETTYGWKFDMNHNRACLDDCNIPALTIRQAIDAIK